MYNFSQTRSESHKLVAGVEYVTLAYIPTTYYYVVLIKLSKKFIVRVSPKNLSN